MATDFIRPPEVLKMHTEMVQKLGELFSVKSTKWNNILSQVKMLNLLPESDVGEIKSMFELFICLVQKKGNDITYGEYASIRTILGSYNTLAEEIIDHYTGRIQAFYKDVPTFEPTRKFYSVKKNQIVILNCKLNTSKTAIVNVQWQRKAKGNDAFTDIEIDDKRYIGGYVKSPSLCIRETREEDNEAIYVCQAKNAAGTGKSDEIRVKITQPEQETILGGYATRPSSFRHEKLKMGCRIGAMNQNALGTLGPFVRYNGNTSFLTCAHVLFNVAQHGTVDFTYDGSNRIDVMQPALNYSMVGGAAFGFIQRAIFNPRMNPSIDVAVVTIYDESRLPTKGRFANVHSFRYKEAGFDDLPEYNDGARVLDFQGFGTSSMVVQFGSETHLSKGFLEVNGTQVKSLSIALGLPFSNVRFCMSGQYEVEGLRSMSDLFMPGDSGAAVFMLNATSLHCIGMAIGSTPTGNAVVTPIAALLDAVGANADIDLSVFH